MSFSALLKLAARFRREAGALDLWIFTFPRPRPGRLSNESSSGSQVPRPSCASYSSSAGSNAIMSRPAALTPWPLSTT